MMQRDQPGALWQPISGVWEGGSRGREHVYTFD